MKTVAAFLLMLCLTPGYAVEENVDYSKCPEIPYFTKSIVDGQKCFIMFTQQYENYETSRNVCKAINGKLALPKTKETNDVLTRLMQKVGSVYNFHAWIGLSDRTEENEFVWEDDNGTKIEPNDFSNFGVDEGPRHTGLLQHKFEDCVAINLYGKWDDMVCEGHLFVLATYHFICELPFEDK